MIASFTGGALVSNWYWSGKYTELELTYSQVKADGEEAAREALQRAIERDRAARDAAELEEREAEQRYIDETNKLRREFADLEQRYDDALVEPDCLDFLDSDLACAFELHPSITADPADRNSDTGAGTVEGDTA